MPVDSTFLEGDILKIVLDGRLDLEGTQAIDLKFAALTATKLAAILVDMTKVGFLASIGIRTLLTAAKLASNRGGKLFLVNPQPSVRDVLNRSGVSSRIAVHPDLESALEAARCPQRRSPVQAG
jgi:anti-anti-sigma factor